VRLSRRILRSVYEMVMQVEAASRRPALNSKTTEKRLVRKGSHFTISSQSGWTPADTRCKLLNSMERCPSG
jgi:hypothetical protein